MKAMVLADWAAGAASSGLDLRQGSGRKQALNWVLSDGRNNAARTARCSGVEFFSINELMLVTRGQGVRSGAR